MAHKAAAEAAWVPGNGQPSAEGGADNLPTIVGDFFMIPNSWWINWGAVFVALLVFN